MPKYYYRCCKCHSKVNFDCSLFGHEVCVWCPKCKVFYNVKYKNRFYSCRHDYWYELFFLTLRDMWRKMIK